MKEKLLALEKATAAPVLPGETEGWCRSVQLKLDDLQTAWDSRIQDDRRVLEEIRRTDPELSARTEALGKRMDSAQTGFTEVKRALDAVNRVQEERPTASHEPHPAAKRISKALLNWIVQARTLQAEIRTLFLEAHYRDRGVGD